MRLIWRLGFLMRGGFVTKFSKVHEILRCSAHPCRSLYVEIKTTGGGKKNERAANGKCIGAPARQFPSLLWLNFESFFFLAFLWFLFLGTDPSNPPLASCTPPLFTPLFAAGISPRNIDFRGQYHSMIYLSLSPLPQFHSPQHFSFISIFICSKETYSTHSALLSSYSATLRRYRPGSCKRQQQRGRKKTYRK